MKKFGKALFLTAAAALAAFTLTGCGSNQASADEVHVRIGVVGSNTDTWDFVSEQLAPEGINLEVISFSDFQQPNQALVEGEIELNAFQHQIFLDAFNEANGTDLTPIAQTFIAPLGIYSLAIEDISEVGEGAQVSIPNDPTNGGRALLLLQTAGLITVDPAAGLWPTVQDITANPFNLDIVELDASHTARSLEDVTIAIINSGMAVEAGFIPSRDAVFLEPITEHSDPYINIIVARAEDTDSEVFARIVEAFQTDEVIQIAYEQNQGSSIPVWNQD